MVGVNIVFVLINNIKITDAMDVVLILIGILFGILNLILFFKLWGMCNDVADMKERLKGAFPTKEEKRTIDIAEKQQAQADGAGFNIGDNVIYEPMKRKMIIKEITENGMLVCISYKQNGKEEYEGTYKPEQVKILD